MSYRPIQAPHRINPDMSVTSRAVMSLCDRRFLGRRSTQLYFGLSGPRVSLPRSPSSPSPVIQCGQRGFYKRKGYAHPRCPICPALHASQQVGLHVIGPAPLTRIALKPGSYIGKSISDRSASLRSRRHDQASSVYLRYEHGNEDGHGDGCPRAVPKFGTYPGLALLRHVRLLGRNGEESIRRYIGERAARGNGARRGKPVVASVVYYTAAAHQ